MNRSFGVLVASRYIATGGDQIELKPQAFNRAATDAETVEYFETSDDHTPLRLTTEAIEQLEPERVTTPLMTYDLSRLNF